MSSWGFCCYENDGEAVFRQLRDEVWDETTIGAGLQGENRLRVLDTLLPKGREVSALKRDTAFFGALRDTALLMSLTSESCLHCKIRADQRDLAGAVIRELYAAALPRLAFLSFAAGTEMPPAGGFRLLFLTDLPERDAEEVAVDFTAGQPLLRLNFSRLNFAQRTARALLPPMGLGLLLSMWNAAGSAAEERLGTQKAAEYTDLVAWLMLRRNFSAVDYPITGAEHRQLQLRVEEYEAMA